MPDAESFERRVDEALTGIRSILEVLLTIQPLTNLPNRLAYLRSVGLLENGQPAAVIAIELSNFKQLNSNYGHAGGDHVLKGVARRLLNFSEIHPDWEFFHFSGDEFYALVQPPGPDALRTAAASLKQTLRQPTYPLEPGRVTRLGEVDSTVAVSYRAALQDADRTDLFSEADELAELGKQWWLWPDDTPPDVLVHQEHAPLIQAALKKQHGRTRRRVHCPMCHRDGVLNEPAGFIDCPECAITRRA